MDVVVNVILVEVKLKRLSRLHLTAEILVTPAHLRPWDLKLVSSLKALASSVKGVPVLLIPL